MSDVVVTVPQSFGLDAWIAEGDAAGEPYGGEEWVFSVSGPCPDVAPGERVYVVYNGRLRGYAPLTELTWQDKLFGAPRPKGFARWGLVRAGGAVAVTIAERVPGFRGWRYRHWRREDEVPFPDWRKP